jgi:hypothetical protein
MAQSYWGGLESYVIQLTVSKELVYKATVINYPVPSYWRIRVNNGATTQTILIGEQAWMKEGAGPWVSTTHAKIRGINAVEMNLTAEIGDADADLGIEIKNGTMSRHYRFLGRTDGVLNGAASDYWIGVDREFLVAFDATDTTGNVSAMQIDVTQVDDPATEIVSPLQ